MPLLLLIAAWFVFGDPPNNVANWFWKADAAPWETVDAFYYPDESDLEVFIVGYGKKTVEQCRDWVYLKAAEYQDWGIKRGDYECAIEPIDSIGSLVIYRATTR